MEKCLSLRRHYQPACHFIVYAAGIAVSFHLFKEVIFTKKVIEKIASIILFLLLAAGLSFGLSACAKSAETDSSASEEKFKIYYLSDDQDELVAEDYQMQASSDDPDGQIKECIKALSVTPETKGAECLYPEEVRIQDYKLNEDILHLNFNKAYSKMDAAREVYVRAGLVHTFLQLDGVDGLCLEINGKALQDAYGKTIGTMSLNSFVENYGESINTYQKVKMTLYFTDETGSNLLPEEREVYYSTGVPLERAVVNEIIKGPKENGHYPTFSADTNILSVVNQEGTCYVNFDESVNKSILNVKGEIPIYSIVDSLAKNCKTKNVQFTIDGQTDVTFRGSVDLNKTYSEDKSLIEGEEVISAISSTSSGE
ncbi:MAG: GerMN domain-containing protein [Eubacterium sp.]|nr:GerMN domain-containing protein [Eubacterium sp.]